MTDPLFEAFTGRHFDPVFSQMAVTSHASGALEVDVRDLHWKAGDAVIRVAEAATEPGADPSRRIALIQGPSGYGKTHRLVTVLLELSQKGRAYPAVMQLSAKVEVGAVSLWMLRKVVDELAASHFADAQGRSPLKRLADHLWAHAPESTKQRYDEALECENLDGAAEEVVAAIPSIRRALQARGLSRSDGPLMAALMLLADDASFDVDAWLRGGSNECRIGRFRLPALARETERHGVLADLARIAIATGAPLIIALDQIESITRIGDDKLLSAVVTTAIQIVENSKQGVGLIISALQTTYDDLIQGKIDESFRQRIVFGQQPVSLERPGDATVRAVLDRRTSVLLQRVGLPADPRASQRIAPDWLLARANHQTLRDLFQAIRDYREVCRESLRFLTEDEYGNDNGDTKDGNGHIEDFEKLWTDLTDDNTGSVANFSPYDREQLFLWLAAHVSEELSGVSGTVVESYQLSDGAATRVIDLRFLSDDGHTVERWKIAFADAPNSRNQLREQINSALNAAFDAKPALLRDGRMVGVKEDGLPDRDSSALRKLQPGPALDDLFKAGGRVAAATQKDWQRLALARRFVAERKDARGFSDWRQQCRFLLEHAGIGQMARLVQPESEGTPTANIEQTRMGGNGSTVVQRAPSVTPLPDPRDHADILIGQDRHGNEVRWRLDKAAEPALPNFGLLVSGDSGQGKTQAIKAIIAEAARLGSPVLIFDFKNDYGDSPDDAFATDNGFTVIELKAGLPFNPLRLPPQAPSGAQAITHIYEVAGILGTSLGLGEQQKSLLRQALERSFNDLRVPLRDWVDPNTTPAPSLSDVVASAEEIDARRSDALINRLGLLHGLRLLPGEAEAHLTFTDMMQGRFVLSFKSLPTDDKLKGALAELILIQLQGHMLRGEQPRALRRLLVFDEAWRAAKSKRLIELAREGRAFGVGVVAGSQFADDLDSDLTGNLATKLHLFNGDAARRRKLVQALFGSSTGGSASALMGRLGKLKKFEGVFANQQYTPFTDVTVRPYYQRRG